MPTILLVEDDPVFAAVVADHLQIAGHRVVHVDEGARAVSTATERPVDLVVLERTLPLVSGHEVIHALREQPETLRLPVLVLSDLPGTEERLALLRVGADDVVDKPVAPEEVQLRVDRLLGTRGHAPPVLTGHLDSHPLRELLQYVRHVGKDGRLIVRSPQGTGEARIHSGQMKRARWQSLEGTQAALAMLSVQDGTFRFEISDESNPGDHDTLLPLNDLLLHAAWMEDELQQRVGFLPATGAGLECLADRLPNLDAQFAELPTDRIFERVRRQPGIRLFDLIDDQAEARLTTRLATALLCEAGALGPETEPGSGGTMTTTEISGSMVLELSIANLLVGARNAGFDTTALPYLLVADAEVWPRLREVLQGAPGYLSNDNLRALVEQLDDRGAGSAAFTTDLGKVSLHVQLSDGSGGTAIENIVPICAGVLVWVGRPPGAIERDIVARLEKARGAAHGVLIAPDLDARQEAKQLVEDTRRWRVSDHAPKSLLGILQLYVPSNGG